MSGGQTDVPALKLTAYFGERSRAGGRLLADELLDLYARRAIRTSVLLRGVQGFGRKHHLRSDRLLTLSEDLPLVSIAIDSAERIAELAGELANIGRDGLVTLERARLWDGRPCPDETDPTELGNSPQLDRFTPTKAGASRRASVEHSEIKLTAYVGRHQRIERAPAFAVACRVLREHGVAGATVLLGVDGTRAGQRQRARFFGRNVGVPMAIVSVGQPDAIEAAVADLVGLLPQAPLTLERTRVCKRDGQLLCAPPEPSGAAPGSRQQLTVVVSEASRHERRPVYLELVRRLRAAGAAGATSLRGVWGFHGEHLPHGDRLLSLRRHVPVITVVIDSPERIASLFPIVDELTREHGLVTSEMVPASSALHDPPTSAS